MKYKCDVIKDLIPLYIDGCTSGESNKIVELHIKECPSCDLYYSQMNSGKTFYDEEEETKRVFNYGKRIKRRRIRLVLIIVLAMILQAGVIIGGMASMMTLGSVYDTNDPHAYGHFDDHFAGEDKGRFSHLMIFPESVDNAWVNEYKYYASDKGLDNEYLIYLDQTLTDHAYTSEIERIKGLKTTYKEKTNNIQNAKLGQFDAYISVYKHNHSYEYVLSDDENHRIIYVYSQFKGPDSYLSEHNLWISDDLEITENNALGDEAGYSMYYFKTDSDQLYMIDSEQLD